MIGPNPLPAETQLYPCLICGGAIPEKGRQFHEDWHASIASAAIGDTRRIEALEQHGQRR